MGISRGTFRTEAALALVALALALRLLIAPGFMPVAGPQGFTVSLCTAQGPVDVQIPGKAPAQTAHDPCPYAALGFPPLIPAVAALAGLPVPLARAIVAAPGLQRPHIGAPAPPPPSTGPPLLG